MHQSSYQIIVQFQKLVETKFPREGIRVLDVGSYGVNGTYKEIFSNTRKYLYTGLDVNPGPNVDYVPADPYSWAELTDDSFDVIISGQAFEHIEYPWLIIEEMERVLKLHGLICIVAPSRGPEHKYPVDCWRYYPDGFRALAKWAGLEVLDAQATWGKSGFHDGSDQWGDAFCILYKSQNQETKQKRRRKAKPPARVVNTDNPLRMGKNDSYYGFSRPEVIEAIIKNKIPVEKVLELGCAGGATGKILKEKLPVKSYVGIDISAEAAEIAKQHLDKVIVTDIEETDLAAEYGLKTGEYDLLLALDVLEHLYNPWDVLAGLATYLKPGGFVVASLPNIQNITIVDDLLKGNWQYLDAGILDATHLRFFTLESLKKMFAGAGLEIIRIERVLLPAINTKDLKDTDNKYRTENLEISSLTREEILNLHTYQYIVIARKKEQGENKSNLLSSGSHDITAQSVRKLQDTDTVPGMTSIVILTFNQLEYTKKCVRSLQKHTPEPHEIIFVDNGSTDGTPKWLRGELKNNKNYKLIENRENLGFSGGCNQGMEASRGEYILLLNNDVVVAKGWLTGLIDCLKYAPEAGIVGPMTNNISGPQQIDDKNYTLERLDQCAQTFLEQYRHRRIPCRRIVGFCMLFKRTLAGRIGLLDESFGTGNFEDDDFCLRSEMAGYRNYIAGDVFIHHFGSRSFIGNRINYRKTMSGNKEIFSKKWTLGMGTPEGKKLAILNAAGMAKRFYARGEIDKAVETLVDCIKYSPDEPLVYYELARYFLETKKFAEARDVVASMPEAAAESLKGLECAAYAHEGLNEDDRAREFAGRMLALDENSATAANLLGILAYKKQDRETAGKYFERACADPGYGEAFLNMGVLHWGQERHTEAWGYLKKGFRLSPSLPYAGTLYYSAARSLDLLDEAREDFAEGLRFYPQNKNLLFLYIDILISGGRHPEAMRKIEDALVSFGPDEGLIGAAKAVRDEIGPLQIEKPGQRGTVSLCMIVKNEERHLAHCLKSVRDIVDEMIIVDTGSTDKTKDIAEIFGAKVFDFPWTGDFSAARNESLAHATGEWVFIMDADEVISPLDYNEFKALVRKKTKKQVAYSIVTRNYTKIVSIIGWQENKGDYPEEAGAGWAPSHKVRLAPRTKGVFFTNPVHELLEPSLKEQKISVYQAKTIVHHYGMLDTVKEQQKGEDYYLLGKIKYESNPDNVKNIYELAKQAYVLNKYEEALELWQKLLAKLEGKPDSHDYRLMATVAGLDPVGEIHTQMATTYLQLGLYDEARKSAAKVIAAPDKDRSAIVTYAQCEIIAGSLENAAKELEALLTQDTDYPPARMTGLILSVILEKKEEAKKFLTALGRGNLSVIQFINTFAGHLQAAGRGSEAMKLLAFLKENNIATQETNRLMEKIEAEAPA